MNSPHRSRRLLAVPMALALGASAFLGACGDDGTTTTAPVESSAPGTTNGAASAELSVTDVWARTSPSMTSAGAVYMQISNPTDEDDALVAVAVDDSVARIAEIHETVMAGGHDGGMMKMQAVDEIPVAAGGSAALEPGGYHVMLLDLVEPLEAGDVLQVTLTFDRAGETVVEAEVRDIAP